MAPLVPDGFAVRRRRRRRTSGSSRSSRAAAEADHAAWSASIDHIRATPGFDGRDWPPARGMSAARNRADLERHARDFAQRRGFTYTVLAPDGDDVLGCVYIYPPRDDDHDPMCDLGAADVDLEVDVRRPPRVPAREDRQEARAPVGVGLLVAAQVARRGARMAGAVEAGVLARLADVTPRQVRVDPVRPLGHLRAQHAGAGRGGGRRPAGQRGGRAPEDAGQAEAAEGGQDFAPADAVSVVHAGQHRSPGPDPPERALGAR